MAHAWSDDDAGAWRHLVARCERHLQGEDKGLGALQAAIRRTRLARFPTPVPLEGRMLFELHQIAKRYYAGDTAERTRLLAAMRLMTARCRKIVGEAGSPPPAAAPAVALRLPYKDD